MEQVEELLRRTRIEVSPETFHLVSLTDEEWLGLLENPELSPRMTAPFMIFRDRWEVTLLFDETDYRRIEGALGGARAASGFRLLSFDLEMGFDVVGYIALIARLLSGAGISIVPVSSFSRDHLLVRQDDLAAALKALREHVEEVC